MKLKKIKQIYLALKVAVGILVGLALLVASKIDIPYTDEALRTTKIWMIILIIALAAIVVSTILLKYFKSKAQKIIQESEILEEGTKYIFEEGEDDEQEK